MLEHETRQSGVKAHQAHVRILETTDLHVNLLPYDYYSDAPSAQVGLARTAALVRRHRSEVANCLLFDNGDFLQGSPISDLAADQHATGTSDIHPAIAAMNVLDYDAVTLGNHEFNYGLGFLKDTLHHAAFPVVSANIFETDHGTDGSGESRRNMVTPWIIIDRDVQLGDGSHRPLRLGVIGFAPPQIPVWDAQILGNDISVDDILTSARTELPKLKAQGVDLVVALSHSGIEDEAETPCMENASVPLAALDGIDVVLAGHSHKCFPGSGYKHTKAVDPIIGTLHGKPAVMAGFYGSHLGVIDLVLEPMGDSWRIVSHSTHLDPIAVSHTQGQRGHRARVLSDAGVIAAVGQTHEQTLNHVRRQIGVTTGQIHSYFARVLNSTSTQVVADAQRRAAQVFVDGTDWADLPLLSATPPFRCGGRSGPLNYVDIPAGPLMIRHASDLYLFPNRMALIEVTGADLRDWLDRSATGFRQITPGGGDQNLIEDNFPSYCFDVIDGLTYRFDLTVPNRYSIAGDLAHPDISRVRDLCHDGHPIEDDDRFVVATSSYRLSGGGHFPIALKKARKVNTGVVLRDTVVDLFRETSPMTPYRRATWGISPVPGSRGLLKTGKGALNSLAGDDPQGLTVLGEEGTGWIDLALDLSAPQA